jgi:hypothetical protein
MEQLETCHPNGRAGHNISLPIEQILLKHKIHETTLNVYKAARLLHPILGHKS